MSGERELPLTTVVVLNWNGRRHLEAGLPALDALDFPRDRLEILVADNGSTDDSVEWLARAHPSARVLRFDRNLGYARAMNAAVRAAEGEFVAFLNNDARAERGWLRHLVRPILEGAADATASKIRSFDGSRVHFARGGSNFHGIAFQWGMDEPEREEFSRSFQSLFPCGAAMALKKSLFLDVGGFDEDFFAYYEDVDLGWRLNVMGFKVLTAPDSIVYHHHSATATRVPIHRLRVFHIRNPLRMIVKNMGDDALARILPAALLLTARRTASFARLDRADFDVNAPVAAQDGKPSGGVLSRLFSGAGRTGDAALPKAGPYEQMPFPKVAVADLLAVNDLLEGWDGLWSARSDVQSRRRRDDRDILPLFVDPFRPAEPDPAYRSLQSRLVDAFRIRELFAER